MLLAGNEQEVVIFRKINEGIVGSNQQERREIGFREYMLKHHPPLPHLGTGLTCQAGQ